MSFCLHQAKKQVRINSNLSFLRRCRSNDVTPKGLRTKNILHSSYNCERAVKLMERHNKQWLQLTIQIEYERRASFLYNCFPLDKSETEEIEKYTKLLQETKNKKFTSLLQEKSNENENEQLTIIQNDIENINGFKNISSIQFDEDEISLLNKGPSFTPGWKNVPKNKEFFQESKSEVLHCIDQLKHMDVSTAQLAEFGGGMINIIKDGIKTMFPRCKTSINKNIMSIQDKTDSVITKSDKTSRMIAMDKSAYDNILEEATIQTGNFAECRTVLPTTRQAKFNNNLVKIAEKYRVDSFVFDKLVKLKTSHPYPASTYILPKDHKSGPLKGRPIVAALDGPGVHLARFLSNCLNNLLCNVPAHLMNCDTFLDKIKDIYFQESYSFASLDIVNLYGSIPKQKSQEESFDIFDALRRFFNSHSEDDQFLRKITVDDFLQLIDMALNNDFVLFRKNQYKQTNGLSMGNPLAPQIAIIYMHYIEQEIIAREPGILNWFRYIDDIFVVWKESTNANNILQTANSINPHIKFTIETPSTEGKLPFLDVNVYVQQNHFSYHLFIKKIHSGATLHWDSECPKSTKISILKNEFLRAKRRSSSPSNAEISYEMIRNRFAANNYPQSVIRSVFYQFVKGSRPSIIRNSKDTIKFLRFPFTDEQTKRRAQSLLRRTRLKDHVKLWFDSGPSLRQLFKPPKERPACDSDCMMCKWEAKDRKNQCQKKNTVYKIECTLCHKIYIGETCRPTKIRMVEHTRRNDKKDAIIQHFDADHAQEEVIFKWQILHFNAKHHNKRKILEAMAIKATPTDKLMNGCKGRDLPLNIN